MKNNNIICIILTYLLLYINLLLFIVYNIEYCLIVDFIVLFYIIKKTLSLKYLIDLELNELETFITLLYYVKSKMESKINLERAMFSFISAKKSEQEIYTIIIKLIKSMCLHTSNSHYKYIFSLSKLVDISLRILIKIYKKSFKSCLLFVNELIDIATQLRENVSFLSIKTHVFFYRSRILSILLSLTSSMITIFPYVLFHSKYVILENSFLFSIYPFILYLFLSKIDEKAALLCSVLFVTLYFLFLKILYMVFSCFKIMLI